MKGLIMNFFQNLQPCTTLGQILKSCHLHRRNEEDDIAFHSNLDPDDLQEGRLYMYWTESPSEFATVGYCIMVPRKPVSADLDETDNFENNGNPSVPRTASLIEARQV